MKDLETFISDSHLSCENYVSVDLLNNLKFFSEVATKLKISLFSVNNLSLMGVKDLLSSDDLQEHSLTSLVEIFHANTTDNFDLNALKKSILDIIVSSKFRKKILISRTTIEEKNIENMKRKLSELREQYEIIAVKTDDVKVLKWAAHDRRVDYISIDLLSKQLQIDPALCSLVKQHNKSFELILSPLLLKDDKELSSAIRYGKKIFKLIKSTNAQYILTMKPQTCFHLRNGIQIRSLARLLNIPLNQSKMNVFEYQLEIALKNLLRLDDSNLLDGIREAS